MHIRANDDASVLVWYTIVTCSLPLLNAVYYVYLTCSLLWLPAIYYDYLESTLTTQSTMAICSVLWLPIVYYGYLQCTIAICSLLCLPIVHYGYLQSTMARCSLLPYSAIIWWGKILVNLAKWQPFANVLPTNICPTLIYSIGAYFYNFILEWVLILSDCCYTYLSFKISLKLFSSDGCGDS